MNCYDCHLAERATAAVGICHWCGAAVCPEHAVVRAHHLTHTVPINRVEVIEPPGRLVGCAVCTAAHDAARAATHS